MQGFASFATNPTYAKIFEALPETLLLNHTPHAMAGSPSRVCTPTKIGSVVAANILSARLIPSTSSDMDDFPRSRHAAEQKRSNGTRPS